MAPTSSPTLRGQLLPQMVDHLANNDPDGVWAEIPRSRNAYKDGFRKITYRDLANGVNGVAWWIRRTCGQSSNFETLAYFGDWDPSYVLLMIGAVKAGYKMVFPSPRYSVEGLSRLLVDDLDCQTMLTTHKPLPIVLDFLKHCPLNRIECPSLEGLLDPVHEYFLYDKVFAKACNEPLVVLHTSGTTNNPKPVVWTHAWAASFFWQNQLEPPKGYESLDRTQQGVRLINLLPVFHCGSLFSYCLMAIANKSTIIYPLPESPLHPSILYDLLSHVSADTAVLPPGFVEAAAKDPKVLALVSTKLTYVGFAGGPISSAAGKTVSSKVKMFCIYACTENGVFPTIRPQGPWITERWNTIKFHPEAGVKLEGVGDGGYELVVQKKARETANSARSQPVFETIPSINEWRTKDIFAADIEEAGSWTYTSRADDIISFSDGTKFNPREYEEEVSAHEEVAAALLFGKQKPNTVLLLELVHPHLLSASELPALLESLWPCIDRANQNSRGFAIVTRPRILFANPEQPLPRAYKGTVQRSRAYQLYEYELDQLCSKG